MAYSYQTFMLSDEPKIAGIPITTGLPVFLLTALGLFTHYTSQLFLIGAVLSTVLHFKFGGLPIRVILSMMYWALPRFMTGMLFRRFPDSAYRLYIR